MSWNNQPSEAQLAAIFRLTKWVLARDLQVAATDWLKVSSSRKEVSKELARLRDLYIARRLNTKEDVFCGDVWKDFSWKEFCHE